LPRHSGFPGVFTAAEVRKWSITDNSGLLRKTSKKLMLRPLRPLEVTGDDTETMNDRILFLAAVILYGVCLGYSIFLWKRGFRKDNHILYGIFAAGLALHTAAMFGRGFRLDRCPINNLYEASVFSLWTVGMAAAVLGAAPRLRFLAAFATPLVFGGGVFALFPNLDVHGQAPEFSHGWESLHAALILLSYGAFGASAAAALMYLSQENDLKFNKARAMFAFMPPIQRLERIVSSLLAAGFALLTAGLLVGSWWLSRNKGYWFSDDPKVLWSVLVWAGYLTLILVRQLTSPRGRRFAWTVVGAFAFVLLTFWGTNLPSTIHHP
jgi:ABC-type uncharacterized transport system permease subunit